MKLAVLNPGGRDPRHEFPNGAGAPNDSILPPVGACGFAACTSGGFYRKDQEIPAELKHVLVLLGDNLKAFRQVFVELRSLGKTIAIAWRDPAPSYIAEQLAKPDKFKLFQEICQRADGAIATTPDLVGFFTAAGARHTEFIPTPWPIDDDRWNFGIPVEERRGIYVGTFEFRAPLQNHLSALLALRQLAASMYERVTLLNTEGRRGREFVKLLGYDEQLLKVVDLPCPPHRNYLKMSYSAFHLSLLAKHKLVWQLDGTGSFGQIAGDALLARVPCVGGVGTTERIVYPELCAHGRETEQLFDLAARLLEHPHDCEAVMERAVTAARDKLSFTAVAQRLETFFKRIAR
ncbi:MAG TPA: hypothetical protein VGM54_15055 [Chthoniobacter sp.]